MYGLTKIITLVITYDPLELYGLALSESAEIPLSACIFLFSLSFSLFSGRFLMSVIQEKDS